MNRLRITFLLCLSGLTLIGASLSTLIKQPSNALTILVFHAVFTWAAFEWSVLDLRPENFLRNYLISIVLKITVGCSFIAILVVVFKESAQMNGLLFISGYLLYTALEVIFLLMARSKV
jgi:hypothetical protein